jgi:hypothetical protein
MKKYLSTNVHIEVCNPIGELLRNYIASERLTAGAAAPEPALSLPEKRILIRSRRRPVTQGWATGIFIFWELGWWGI